MKIATYIDKLTGGGAERVAATLSKYLNKNFDHIFIINRSSESYYDYSGVTILTGFSKENKSLLSRLIQRTKALYTTKKKIKPGATISHLYSSNFSNLLTDTGDKKVVVIHGKDSVYKNAIEKLISKYLLKKADAVVSISKYYEDVMIREMGIKPEKSFQIYNPIDISMIQEQLSEPVEENNKQLVTSEGPIFVNIGRYDDSKGLWHAIRSFSKVVKQEPKAKLLIIGGGNEAEKNYYLTLIQDLQLVDNVFLLGRKQNPFSYLKHATALYNTSVHEGLPLVIMESLVCNVPVISTDCTCGPRELLAPHSDFMFRTKENEIAEYGILTPALDGVKYDAQTPLTEEEEKLANAALLFLQQPSLRDEFKNGMADYIQKFDLERIGKEYEDLIWSIVKQ